MGDCQCSRIRYVCMVVNLDYSLGRNKMSTGYLCGNSSCRWLGSDVDTHLEHEVDREPGKATIQLDYEVAECPACGSSDLTEVELCERCIEDGIETEADFPEDGLCSPHKAEEDYSMAEHAHDIRMGK